MQKVLKRQEAQQKTQRIVWQLLIEYTISHVNERKLDMVYEPFDIQLTEY